MKSKDEIIREVAVHLSILSPKTEMSNIEKLLKVYINSNSIVPKTIYYLKHLPVITFEFSTNKQSTLGTKFLNIQLRQDGSGIYWHRQSIIPCTLKEYNSNFVTYDLIP